MDRNGGLQGTTIKESASDRDCIWVGAHLVHNVLERVRAVDGKADKEEVGLWV